MNHYFVICDEEKEYVDRFTALVNERRMVPYRIQGITDVQQLVVFCKENIVEVLLMDEDLYQEYQSQITVKNLVLLTEIAGKESQGCLFKYQPVSTLIRKSVNDTQKQPVSIPKDSARLIGIYSPIRGNDKTLFSLALGQILAKEQGVIYLNFASLTGVTELLGGQCKGDLTDVLYLMSQGKKELECWRDRCIGTINNLDYVLPVVSPLDLRNAPSNYWMELIDILCGCGHYQTLIIELDESCEVFLPILQKCSVLYMPLREDTLAGGQRREYEQWLCNIGQSALIKRTIPVKLPFHKGFGNRGQFVEQLVWGEFGDYVRSLLWGK